MEQLARLGNLKTRGVRPGRRCGDCGSPEPHGRWNKDGDGYFCNPCRIERRRRDFKKTKFDDCLSVLAKRTLFDPNFDPHSDRRGRQCASCGTTTSLTMGKAGREICDWYRPEIGKGGRGRIKPGEQVTV